jgi:hypothetical protein
MGVIVDSGVGKKKSLLVKVLFLSAKNTVSPHYALIL